MSKECERAREAVVLAFELFGQTKPEHMGDRVAWEKLQCMTKNAAGEREPVR